MKPPKFADLHIHTSFSDSTFSPQEVMQHASECNLSTIAITDHDCVDGVSPAIDLAPRYNIEIIPGIELTAKGEGCEVHILGFYIDWKNESLLQELKKICQNRVERMYKMVEKLKEAGVEVAAEEVFEFSGGGSVGRMHLGAILLKHGYASSIDEVFTRFIGDSSPCYVKRLRPRPKEAIEMISRVGGIPVLAHPHTMRRDDLIPELIKNGIKGIEAYYPNQSDSTIKKYEELARKYNLIVSGGSDCHGLGKGEPSMGKVKVPYQLVEKLKDRLSQR